MRQCPQQTCIKKGCNGKPNLISCPQELHLKSRYNHYELGEHAHRLLSHQIRQAEAEAYISEIETVEGNTTINQPISLLVVDYKILTKSLATRLDTVIQKMHPDQSGFISGRQLYGNLLRLYNIIYSPKAPTTAEVLISLDAHKAFDRIEYEYLNIFLKC